MCLLYTVCLVFINLDGLTGKRAAVELLKIAFLCYLDQNLGEHKEHFCAAENILWH